MKLDKSKWKIYKFGEIAFNISERVEPSDTDAQIYVGLEHLDSDNIHISRHGKPSDVKGIKLKVYKGDIIFGKRRAYQRKAAIADFNGICSAHAMVLRANPQIIHPDLFPFFIHSDVFMNQAIDVSEGSLSPTIKWKTLAQLEFLLPPLDQQQELGELLWSGNSLLNSYRILKDNLKHLISSEIDNLIWNANYPTSQLRKISINNKFIDGDWIENKDMSESGVRLIQLADIGINEFLNKSNKYISEDTFDRLHCFELLPGDLLMARMPDPIGRTCEIPNINQKLITAVDCCIIRIDETKHNKQFWLYLLNSKKMQLCYNKISSGTTRIRLSKKSLENLDVPMPDLKTQILISDNLSKIQTTYITYGQQINCIFEVNKKLTKEIFCL